MTTSVASAGMVQSSKDFMLHGGKEFSAPKGPRNVDFDRSNATNGASPDVLKLKKAASQFEAMLLSKWWSAMKESGIGADDDNSDPGHDTLDEMGMQAMSTAVAESGGIGIASMLVHSLLSNLPEVTSATSGSASAKPQ